MNDPYGSVRDVEDFWFHAYRPVPGDIVLDIGAGIGTATRVFSEAVGEHGRVLAIDSKIDRLSMAQLQGAEIINFEQENPVETVVELTGGVGVDRVIDAVGVDAEHPHSGPGRDKSQEKQFEKEVEQIAPEAHPRGGHWHPGDAPTKPGLAMGGRCSRQGGHAGYHWRLSAARQNLPKLVWQ